MKRYCDMEIKYSDTKDFDAKDIYSAMVIKNL